MYTRSDRKLSPKLTALIEALITATSKKEEDHILTLIPHIDPKEVLILSNDFKRPAQYPLLMAALKGMNRAVKSLIRQGVPFSAALIGKIYFEIMLPFYEKLKLVFTNFIIKELRKCRSEGMDVVKKLESVNVTEKQQKVKEALIKFLLEPDKDNVLSGKEMRTALLAMCKEWDQKNLLSVLLDQRILKKVSYWNKYILNNGMIPSLAQVKCFIATYTVDPKLLEGKKDKFLIEFREVLIAIRNIIEEARETLNQFTEVIQIIIEEMPFYNHLEIFESGRIHQTLLHLAVRYSHVPIAKKLLSYKSNYDLIAQCDSEGFTPYELACQNGLNDIKALMEQTNVGKNLVGFIAESRNARAQYSQEHNRIIELVFLIGEYFSNLRQKNNQPDQERIEQRNRILTLINEINPLVLSHILKEGDTLLHRVINNQSYDSELAIALIDKMRGHSWVNQRGQVRESMMLPLYKCYCYASDLNVARSLESAGALASLKATTISGDNLLHLLCRDTFKDAHKISIVLTLGGDELAATKNLLGKFPEDLLDAKIKNLAAAEQNARLIPHIRSLLQQAKTRALETRNNENEETALTNRIKAHYAVLAFWENIGFRGLFSSPMFVSDMERSTVATETNNRFQRSNKI